ncbi:MAG: hypothetical protein DRO99_03570 [Candidatus Aenigmatarchaeota archaeon]|nr:MAG: hypothetical protein DRO99_03570 [Candidatus Aenigmarchaeota archaeon]
MKKLSVLMSSAASMMIATCPVLAYDGISGAVLFSSQGHAIYILTFFVLVILAVLYIKRKK